MFSHRLRLLSIFIFLSFIILIFTLFSFQVIHSSHYKNLSIRNAVRIIPLKAPRGTIYDRNQLPLAKDEISFDLVLMPQEVDDLDKVLATLGKITDIDKDILKTNYKKNYRLPFVPVNLVTDINPKRAFKIEERLLGTPGVFIRTEPIRRYPNNQVASHVIGYVGKIGESEFTHLKDYGYKVRDYVGKDGVEKHYDVYLQGEDGGKRIEVDAKSRQIAELGLKKPIKGKDVTLTIDLGLQRFLDMLFEGKKGSMIVMNAKTGQILGMLSAPEFDPNIFISGTDAARLAILRDKSKPLLNRAISGTYPPGSTFKIVVAIAGVATGAVNNTTTFLCNGYFKLGRREWKCWKKTGHGYQNVKEALTHSCNVFFYNLGSALGAEGIHRYSTLFGLGSLTEIDLPGEKKGVAPGPIWKRFFLKQSWYKGDTVNYSIGQGYLLVTPMQMLKVATIAANSGYSPQPYIVEKIANRNTSLKKTYFTRIKSKYFEIIRDGLFRVVNSETGTGQNAKVKDLDICGKTGTAQPGTKGDTHAWFCGYMPSKDPKISFVLFLEHGGKGGAEPARMARLMGLYLKENGFLE